MTSEDEKALGPFVRAHRTDGGRCGTTALVSLVVGLAAAAISVPLLIIAFTATEGVRRGLVPGLVLGVALVSLWSAASNGLRYLTRHDEVFKVREGGLVHQCAGQTRVIPWEDITAVNDSGQDNAFSRSMGWDVHCRIRVNGGDRLRVSGFTADARDLVHTVRQAVHDNVRPNPPARG